MIDKGKYASHGTFIRRIQEGCLARWDKPKNAVIHPLPCTKPREPRSEGDGDMQVSSSQIKTKHKFQERPVRKIVPQELVQPFLYIEKVIRRRKVDEVQHPHKQNFIVNNKVKRPLFPPKLQANIPQGYLTLHELEKDKAKTANTVFQKLAEADVPQIKPLYLQWNGHKNKTKELLVLEPEFLSLVNHLAPAKIANQTLKRFFRLYRNPPPKGKETQPELQFISIQTFSYNYEKYKKSLEITNILSEKALRERFNKLKLYSEDFHASYQGVKASMKQIKQYQENLRNYLKQVYEGYRNPYQEDISGLKAELERPIIKYDVKKKKKINEDIAQLEQHSHDLYIKITDDYNYFMEGYQNAIRINHDLFFTKRTVNKLLLPLIHTNPNITRESLQHQIAHQQNSKQEYLECLSGLIIEIDTDKKNLNEDCFTLAEIINTIMMRTKTHKKLPTKEYPQQLVVSSFKKFLKEVKRQFLLKNEFLVDDLENFPADVEIPMDIMHRCFEMECTKVLLKNQIWTELINLIPPENPKSNYHQLTIDSNVCLQFLNRYFQRLDLRLAAQIIKSKQASLLAEKVQLTTFGSYAAVLNQVMDRLKDYVEQADQQEPLPTQTNKKKVGFADVVNQQLVKEDFPEQYAQSLSKKEADSMIKSIIKAIHEPQHSNIKEGNQQIEVQYDTIPENISMLKTLAKSQFIPQNNFLNTNCFDIRFYQKMGQNQPIQNQEIIRMGNSILLSHLPKVQELPVSIDDPLRISRFLLTNLDKGFQQTEKVVHERVVQKNVKEGVSHNYYQQKVKLQNKPTTWDCEGKTKYSLLFPVGYYQGMMVEAQEKDKWYLRPHHLQTLTQNPLSKKDNLIKTEYQSKMEKLPQKKMEHQFQIQEKVKRKQHAIESLQQRLLKLKNQLQLVQQNKGSKAKGATVGTSQLDKYLMNLTDGKEDKQLQIASYQAILYDLRKEQRNLLSGYRDEKFQNHGQPTQKWWEKKDKLFNREVRKQRLMVADSLSLEHKHKKYVEKLKNNELY